MSDILICRYDGEEILLKHFSRHLKLHHQKDYREYIREYINDFADYGWSLCSICSSPVKGVACSGACIKQHYSNIRKGISKGPMSEETKQKLSEDRKQKYANGWAPRIGKTHSDESKLKNSLSHVGKKMPTIKGSCNPANRPEVKQKISETRIRLGIAKGENNPMFRRTHTPEAIRKIFAHRRMNKLEKLVADELDKAAIPYHFQFFITEDGVCKSFDFKIKNKPLIIEVDGDFWHGNPHTKYHDFNVAQTKRNDIEKTKLAESKGYKVVRLWESDIQKDPSIVLKYVLE